MSDGEWVLDPTVDSVEISLTAGFQIDSSWTITFLDNDSVSLPPVMIAESNVVIEVRGLSLYYSENQTLPPGLVDGFGESLLQKLSSICRLSCLSYYLTA